MGIEYCKTEWTIPGVAGRFVEGRDRAQDVLQHCPAVHTLHGRGRGCLGHTPVGG